MSDTVLILGAGFSRDAGVPLLSGFVERMLDLQVRKKHNGNPLSQSDADVLDAAIKVRNELDEYHGRARFDDRNIEDILSILSFNVLGGAPDEREKLEAFNRAIARTIELSCQVTHDGVSREGSAKAISTGPETYRRFWKALLKRASEKHEIPAILTFNYDLVLERSLLQTLVGVTYNESEPLPIRGIQIQYHHDLVPNQLFKTEYCRYGDGKTGTRLSFPNPGSSVEATTIEILKLHGSVNFPRARPSENDDVAYNIAASLSDPIILPPIFNKMTADTPTRIWRAALQHLRDAKNIVVVGYSLPQTDIYMQYFLKAAVGPNVNLNRIFVFDPELYRDPLKAKDMRDRYESCFAEQLRRRIDFQPLLVAGAARHEEDRGTFKHFVAVLEQSPNSILF